MITIPAGEDSASLVIEVAGDSEFERDESFRVVIFDPPMGWRISDSTAYAKILSDETAIGIASVNTAMSVQPEGDIDSGATYSFLRFSDTATRVLRRRFNGKFSTRG